MADNTITLKLNANELEHLRLALSDWCESNVKVMLDDMKDFAREERKAQILYHEELLALLFQIGHNENVLHNRKVVEEQLTKKSRK